MAKNMYFQTVLTDEDIKALKEKTGEPSTKDALAKAVEHYLRCEYTKCSEAVPVDSVIEALKNREEKKHTGEMI